MADVNDAEKMMAQMGLIDTSDMAIEQRHAFMERAGSHQDQQMAWAIAFEVVSVLQQYGPENPVLVGDLAAVLSAVVVGRYRFMREALLKAAEDTGVDPDAIPVKIDVMAVEVTDLPIGHFDA